MKRMQKPKIVLSREKRQRFLLTKVAGKTQLEKTGQILTPF